MSKNIKNAFWHLLDTILYPILFLLSSSWFIKKLGENEFGIWMMVNSIVVTMQMFNLGLGSATFKNVAAHSGLHNFEAVKQTINTNFSISILLHACSVLAGGIVAYGITFHGLFRIEAPYIHMAAGGALVAGFITGLRFYEQLIAFTFKALEKFHIAAWLNTGIKLSMLLIAAVFVMNGFGLFAILAAMISTSAAGILAGFAVLKKQIPGYSLSFHFDKNKYRKEFDFAKWVWLQSLIIIFTFQFDRFFVLTYIGLSTLTYYGLVATIFNHVHMGFTSLFSWMGPRATLHYMQKRDSTKLYINTRNLSVFISLSAILLFSIISIPLFKWLNAPIHFSYVPDLIKWFSVFEVFFIYTLIPSIYLNAAGFEKLNLRLTVSFCLLLITGIVTGFALLPAVKGVILGMAFGAFAGSLLQYAVLNKTVLHDSRFFAEAISLFLPALCIAWFILGETQMQKYLSLGAAAASLFFFLVQFNKVDLAIIKNE